jgi:DNA-binding IclR family transcriptional regulator
VVFLAVGSVRGEHLGSDLAEIIELLDKAGPFGSNTGFLSRSMGYDQPNVYLTLRGLIGLGFVEKDESGRPHSYRLSKVLKDEPPADEL